MSRRIVLVEGVHDGEEFPAVDGLHEWPPPEVLLVARGWREDVIEAHRPLLTPGMDRVLLLYPLDQADKIRETAFRYRRVDVGDEEAVYLYDGRMTIDGDHRVAR